MEENKEKTIEMSVATYARLVELETRVQMAGTYLENCSAYPDKEMVQQCLGLPFSCKQKHD